MSEVKWSKILPVWLIERDHIHRLKIIGRAQDFDKCANDRCRIRPLSGMVNRASRMCYAAFDRSIGKPNKLVVIANPTVVSIISRLQKRNFPIGNPRKDVLTLLYNFEQYNPLPHSESFVLDESEVITDDEITQFLEATGNQIAFVKEHKTVEQPEITPITRFTGLMTEDGPGV